MGNTYQMEMLPKVAKAASILDAEWSGLCALCKSCAEEAGCTVVKLYSPFIPIPRSGRGLLARGMIRDSIEEIGLVSWLTSLVHCSRCSLFARLLSRSNSWYMASRRLSKCRMTWMPARLTPRLCCKRRIRRSWMTSSSL